MLPSNTFSWFSLPPCIDISAGNLISVILSFDKNTLYATDMSAKQIRVNKQKSTKENDLESFIIAPATKTLFIVATIIDGQNRWPKNASNNKTNYS